MVAYERIRGGGLRDPRRGVILSQAEAFKPHKTNWLLARPEAGGLESSYSLAYKKAPNEVAKYYEKFNKIIKHYDDMIADPKLDDAQRAILLKKREEALTEVKLTKNDIDDLYSKKTWEQKLMSKIDELGKEISHLHWKNDLHQNPALSNATFENNNGAWLAESNTPSESSLNGSVMSTVHTPETSDDEDENPPTGILHGMPAGSNADPAQVIAQAVQHQDDDSDDDPGVIHVATPQHLLAEPAKAATAPAVAKPVVQRPLTPPPGPDLVAGPSTPSRVFATPNMSTPRTPGRVVDITSPSHVIEIGKDSDDEEDVNEEDDEEKQLGSAKKNVHSMKTRSKGAGIGDLFDVARFKSIHPGHKIDFGPISIEVMPADKEEKKKKKKEVDGDGLMLPGTHPSESTAPSRRRGKIGGTRL